MQTFQKIAPAKSFIDMEHWKEMNIKTQNENQGKKS